MSWFDYEDDVGDSEDETASPLRIRDILKKSEDLDVDDPDGEESISSRLKTQQVEVAEEEEEVVEVEEEWVDTEISSIGDQEEVAQVAAVEDEAEPEELKSEVPDLGDVPNIDQDAPHSEDSIEQPVSSEPPSVVYQDEDLQNPSATQPEEPFDFPDIDSSDPDVSERDVPQLPAVEDELHEMPHPQEIEEEEDLETPEIDQPQEESFESPSVPDATEDLFEMPSLPDATDAGDLNIPGSPDVDEFPDSVPSIGGPEEPDLSVNLREGPDEPFGHEWSAPEMPRPDDIDFWSPQQSQEPEHRSWDPIRSQEEPSGFLGETTDDPVRESEVEGTSDLHDVYDVTSKRIASQDKQADDLTEGLLTGMRPMFDELRLKQEMAVHDTMTRMIAEQQMLDDY